MRKRRDSMGNQYSEDLFQSIVVTALSFVIVFTEMSYIEKIKI